MPRSLRKINPPSKPPPFPYTRKTSYFSKGEKKERKCFIRINKACFPLHKSKKM